jgi:uncharacterized membrane protein (UPF0127 family)
MTKNSLTKYILLSLIIFLILAGALSLILKKDSKREVQTLKTTLGLSSTLSERAQATGEVKFNGQVLVQKLYVVDGNSNRGNLGLSGISDLQNSGMLFFYPQVKTVNFWMKDMLIDLDIIWLGCDGQILGWQADAKPSDYPKTYPSPKLNYVLEVESGFVAKNQLKVDDKLELKLSDASFECKTK